MSEILLIPTGYSQAIQMYPMNFEEFIIGLGLICKLFHI